MKKSPVPSSLKFFLSGFILALFMITTWSFIAPGEGPPTISVAEANTYFKNYFTTASPYPSNTIIKGIVIDKAQLDAMNALVSRDASINTFRIYMGKDSTSSMALVVGVDVNGRDMTGTIYQSTLDRMGPCPVVCDANSPITRQ